MPASKVLYDLRQAYYEMPDPGDDRNIAPDRSPCVVPIVTAAAETRGLPDPTRAGLLLVLVLKTDGGDCVITATTAYTPAGTTELTLSEAGETVALMSVPLGTSFVWRVLSRQGAAALTDQLTTITHTAPSADDFAIQALTTTTPFGFATADEGNTVLKVIANLQTRMAEMEARQQAAGQIQ